MQDDGTKFRGIFTKYLVDDLGIGKYIVLYSAESNPNEYYSMKTYRATAVNYSTHWDFSNDLGSTWNNNSDGYETEMNINWFYDGLDPTAFICRF